MSSNDKTGGTAPREDEAGLAARVREAAETARERAAEAYAAARERGGAAYQGAREKVGSAGRRASDGIDASPVGALIGGLALGGLIAAVLPRTRREDALLGEYGQRLRDSARDAAQAARDAGVGKLGEVGAAGAVTETVRVIRDTMASSSEKPARRKSKASADG